MKRLIASIITLTLLLSLPTSVMAEESSATPQPLKVLSIGNSFSFDTQKWFYQIAHSAGVETISGQVYYGGYSLADHWNSAKNDLPSYIYYKNADGTMNNTQKQTMASIIADEDWDIITFQQASHDSGKPQTYEPYLTDLIQYVNEHKTNPNAKLVWLQTWAYSQDSPNPNFPDYAKSQTLMYDCIINAGIQTAAAHGEISSVVPLGTAIQNVRTGSIGDTLTRDGYHLSLNAGRYIAGLTLFSALTGISPDQVSYIPADPNDAAITEAMLAEIREGVKNALAKPNEITVSVSAPAGYELPWRAIDVSDKGVYDEKTEQFTFTGSGVVAKSKTEQAYYPDRALDLSGKYCAYLNGKFYAPQLLLDYMDGIIKEKCNPYTTINAYVDLVIPDKTTPAVKQGELTVKNLLPGASVSGKLTFISPPEFAALGEISVETIGAQQSSIIRFDCPEIPVDTPDIELIWNLTLDSGILYNGSRPVHFMYAGRNNSAVTLDGVVAENEWKTLPVEVTNYKGYATYGGADDLYVKTMVMYDDAGLYFAFVVKDNIFIQTQTPVNYWQGDSIQIAIYDDVNDYMKSGTSNTSQNAFNIAIDNGKLAVYRAKCQTADTAIGVIDDVRGAYTIDGDVMTYEFMLTWEQALGYKPSKDYLGIAYLFNDADSDAGRTGYGQIASSYTENAKFWKLYFADFDDDVKIFINGSRVLCDQPPLLINDRTMVPLRAIFEALGAQVEWNGATQTATAIKDNITISLTIGSDSLYVNGQASILDSPALLINDRTMVPVRAISEGFGLEVNWVDETQEVIITRK